jgi:hypothetical protein
LFRFSRHRHHLSPPHPHPRPKRAREGFRSFFSPSTPSLLPPRPHPRLNLKRMRFSFLFFFFLLLTPSFDSVDTPPSPSPQRACEGSPFVLLSTNMLSRCPPSPSSESPKMQGCSHHPSPLSRFKRERVFLPPPSLQMRGHSCQPPHSKREVPPLPQLRGGKGSHPNPQRSKRTHPALASGARRRFHRA